jgi:hypothetical protein
MTRVQSGQAFLSEYLAAHGSFDFRNADGLTFQGWLKDEVERRQKLDEIFQLKVQLRDITRDNHPQYTQLNQRVEEALDQYQRSVHYCEIENLQVRLHNNDRANQGIALAIKEGRLPRGCEKQSHFLKEAEEYQRELTTVLKICPEYQHHKSKEQALRSFENDIGMTGLKSKIRAIQGQQGRSSGRSGSDFERLAGDLVKERLWPLLGEYDSGSPSDLHCLSGVTLGCARGELDIVVVEQKADRETVDVRAIVEVKKNVNDLARSFLIRQENIAWFSGNKDRYLAADYRTKKYRLGHFDKTAVHKQSDRDWRFDQSSFDHFVIDEKLNHYLTGLYFITHLKPVIGASAGEQSRLIHSYSTDFYSDFNDEIYVKKLQSWMKEWLTDFQSRDVLTLYNSSAAYARQILFVD